MTEYQEHGLHITISQLKKILTAGEKKTTVTIRILKKNLHGDHKLLLTKTQINKINKSTSGLDLKLSITQVKKIHKKFIELQNNNEIKTGGFLPLLALLPLLFKGIVAAGAAAGGTAGIVSAVKNARATEAAQAEQIRHNKEIEDQLQKSGTGILSDLAEKIPVFGTTIKYALQKLGLGIDECNRIKNGECVCLGKGLFLDPVGSGLYLGPKSGHGLFLDPHPR
jgi:hypothetical protein